MNFAPKNADLRRLLDDVDPDWERNQVSRPRPSSLQLVSRTADDSSGFPACGWQPFYMRGVNWEWLCRAGIRPSFRPTRLSTQAGWPVWLQCKPTPYAFTPSCPPLFTERCAAGTRRIRIAPCGWSTESGRSSRRRHDFEGSNWKEVSEQRCAGWSMSSMEQPPLRPGGAMLPDVMMRMFLEWMLALHHRPGMGAIRSQGV